VNISIKNTHKTIENMAMFCAFLISPLASAWDGAVSGTISTITGSDNYSFRLVFFWGE
jgi:hypothetical protein